VAHRRSRTRGEAISVWRPSVGHNRRATGGAEVRGAMRGIVPRATSVAEFKAFVESESRKFGSVIERANIVLSN